LGSILPLWYLDVPGENFFNNHTRRYEMEKETVTQVVTTYGIIDLPTMDTTISDLSIIAGLDHHYHFKVVGYGEIPDIEWTTTDGYRIEPVAFPPRGLKRVMCLLEEDIPILGYVVIHEPKPAKKPVEKKPEVQAFKIVKPAPPIVPARDSSGEVLKAVGQVVTAFVAIMGIVLMVVIRVGMTAVMIDPMIIVVLDDPQRTWLQIESYYD
jgi:hypothetical protein